MNTKAILQPIQSRFLLEQSTTTVLLKAANEIASAIDNSKYAVLILMLFDQSKAFDLVNLELLLAKLSYIGKAILRWF